MALRSVNIDSSDLELVATFIEAFGSQVSAKTQLNLFRLAKSFRLKARTPTVKSAKAKGASLQMDVCAFLCKLLGIDFNNQDDSCPVHSRGGGQHGSDVVLTGVARELLPFSFECKAVRSFDFKSSMKQAKANTQEGQIPVVVHRPLNDSMYMILEPDGFSRLVSDFVL